MKQPLLALVLVGMAALACAQTPAPATPAAPAAEMTAQQSKMGQCNQKAKGMTGDARKAYMKDCLSAKAETKTDAKADAKPATQQEKMKSCNAAAAEQKLSGDPRKAFMKDCLSKK